jgi:hypothetical protein
MRVAEVHDKLQFDGGEAVEWHVATSERAMHRVRGSAGSNLRKHSGIARTNNNISLGQWRKAFAMVSGARQSAMCPSATFATGSPDE